MALNPDKGTKAPTAEAATAATAADAAEPTPAQEFDDAFDEAIEADLAKANAEPAAAEHDAADEDVADAKPAKDASKNASAEPADKPTGDDAKTGKDAVEAEPEQEEAPDPLANASPEVKAAFDALKVRADKAEHENTSNRGRISAYQEELRQQRDAAGKPAAAKPSDGTKPGVKAFATKEFKTFAEDYPEVAKMIEAGVNSAVEEVQAENVTLRKELDGISGEHRAENLNRQFQTVLDAHPDYSKIKGSDEFKEWFKTSPAYVQDGVKRNSEYIIDGSEVSDIVQRFKDETGFGEQPAPAGKDGKPAAAPADTNIAGKRARQRQSATAVKGGGIPPAGGPPTDFDGAFDYAVREDERKARQAEAR